MSGHRRRGAPGRARVRVGVVLPPIVVGVVFLLAWELFVEWRDIKPYLLPSPSAIWDELVANRSSIARAARETGVNALLGLVAGSVLAVVAALVTSRSRWIAEVSVPVAAAINAIPIVALAPLCNNLFTITSPTPRRVVVTLVVFFPVFVNTLRGLLEADPTKVELLRSYAAGEWTLLRKVKVPGALPFLCTGLKVASSLSVIAAVVAEYFGGIQNGLGSRITSAASATAYGRAWAYVVGASALGLIFYLAALLVERLAMPWQARRNAS